MLYISSRSKTDSFTSHRTLCTDRAPDFGVYIPYKTPFFTKSELQELCSKPFSEVVSTVLNLFFSNKLSSWDIDACAGKLPVRVREMSFRLFIAECFHNPADDYQYIEKYIYQKIADKDSQPEPTIWAKIAIRIAFLFGIYTVYTDSFDTGFDVSVISDSFILPISVFYAQKMGLPVRTIICCSTDNDRIWDFIQRGEYNLSQHDSPDQIEALLYHRFGTKSLSFIRQLCQKNVAYRMEDKDRLHCCDGFIASVVSADRIDSIIRNVYNTHQYKITEETAITYSGLQDYRAATGESRNTLVFMDKNPG